MSSHLIHSGGSHCMCQMTLNNFVHYFASHRLVKVLNCMGLFEKEYPRRHWLASNTFDAFVQMHPACLLDVWKRIFVRTAQKLTDDRHPHKKLAIQRFEDNLTIGGAQNPFFISPRSRQKKKTKPAKRVQSLFLEFVH